MASEDMAKKIKELRQERDLTLEQVAQIVGVGKSTVRKWETGMIANMKRDKIAALARALGTTPAYLMGWEETPHTYLLPPLANISPILTQRIPMLGKVACGQPIYTDEDKECYVQAGMNIHADFCLTACGDSMIGARIYDGDIVFCRSQTSVENGEIAVVLINDEATLKRVYFYPEKKKLVLQAENPRYEPFVYIEDELTDIKILGKAIAFQSNLK